MRSIHLLAALAAVAAITPANAARADLGDMIELGNQPCQIFPIEVCPPDRPITKPTPPLR